MRSRAKAALPTESVSRGEVEARSEEEDKRERALLRWVVPPIAVAPNAAKGCFTRGAARW